MDALWGDLKIPDADFDISSLHSALDRRRIDRGLSWNALTREVNREGERHDVHPISASTLSGLQRQRIGVEADGVLQMLLWLDRTPESFVPGHPGATHPDALLPQPSRSNVLRFDVPLIYSKLETQRLSKKLKWPEVAVEIGGFCNAASLRNMGRRQRTAFPHVMRLARWLRCPAAALTRLSPV